ncbi:MAG: response regulator [Planctomycetes bacterium]|nr:response regulator [Planctomycetota bacterium]MBL7184792.1 response regulator [Phycisphaerae bacterium]
MSKKDDSKKSEKILIVDDEENMRRTLADILIDEGYSVSTAATGEEAVELCSKVPHDTILMDVRMPGIDGVEAFRQIRRHKEGVRVILMSAYSIDALREAALDEGAIAFLSKPLDLEKVISLIGEVKDTTILVVEDDEHTADLLGANLKEQGYRVTIAKSSHDALELVEQIRFDLIFLDANLPSMNGLELYLAIKKVTPTAVAIMISGMEKEFEEIAKEAVRRNAYTIVRKPLDIDHILGMLQRITSKRISGDNRKPPP